MQEVGKEGVCCQIAFAEVFYLDEDAGDEEGRKEFFDSLGEESVQVVVAFSLDGGDESVACEEEESCDNHDGPSAYFVYDAGEDGCLGLEEEGGWGEGSLALEGREGALDQRADKNRESARHAGERRGEE